MHYSQYFLGPWRTNLKTQKSLIEKKKKKTVTNSS